MQRRSNGFLRRRSLAAQALVLVLTTGVAIGWGGPPVTEPDHKPDGEKLSQPQPPREANVVIFLVDTLRADYLHVYGYARPTSPTVDALAASGVLFEQGQAPSPWTLPTVASLQLSQFACEHGVLVDRQRIRADADPIAARLHRVGYATASFLRNGYAGRMSGLDKGFDLCRMMKRQTDGSAIGPWLDGLGGRPFFLYIHNTEPHNPFEAPEDCTEQFGEVPNPVRCRFAQFSSVYRHLTRTDYDRMQPLGTTDNTSEQQEAVADLDGIRARVETMYAASVLQADQNLKSVIDQLKQRGLWDRTLFILLADHGEEMGERGMWQHDQSVHEELIHVPLIIRFPHDEFARRRVTEPVSLVDVLPTIMDYLRRPELSHDARGCSLMPLIRGDGDVKTGELKVTAMRHNRKKYFRPNKDKRGDLNVVVRQGRWKGIWNVEVGTFELYDLSSDPAERTDLSSRQTERAKTMHAFAEAWLKPFRGQADQASPDDGRVIDEQTRRLLRALGYLDDPSEQDRDQPKSPKQP